MEDTDAADVDIDARYGPEVAALVVEVTRDKPLWNAEREAAQEAHVLDASDRAKRIDLAVEASNPTALARTPPA